MRKKASFVAWAVLLQACTPGCVARSEAAPDDFGGARAGAHSFRQLQHSAGHNMSSRLTRRSSETRPTQTTPKKLTRHGGHPRRDLPFDPRSLPVGGVPAKELRQRRPIPFSRVKSGLGNAAMAQASRNIHPNSDFAYTVTEKEWAVLVVSSAALIAVDMSGVDEVFSNTLVRHILRLSMWVALAMGYSLLVVYWSGWTSGYLWLDGYLLDWALSFDNLFAFHVVMTYFKVPSILQRKAIVYGVMGAVVCRILFYLMFSTVLQMLTWCQPVCGIFLIYTAICTLREDGDDDLSVSDVIFVKRSQSVLGPILDTTYDLEGRGLFRWSESGVRATPLLLCVMVLWIVDTIFAIDSVSAKVVEIPSQFLACSSSMLALLGMGAMYPLLQDVVDSVFLLKYAVGAILTFIGCQLIVSKWATIPAEVSLGVIATVIGVALLGSLPRALGPATK